jgi:hypothetical protein
LRQSEILATLCEVVYGLVEGSATAPLAVEAQSRPSTSRECSSAETPLLGGVEAGKQLSSQLAEETQRAIAEVSQSDGTAVEIQAREAGVEESSEDAMARLTAEADAAMERDFAGLWSNALEDVQSRDDPDMDLSWLNKADVSAHPAENSSLHPDDANDNVASPPPPSPPPLHASKGSHSAHEAEDMAQDGAEMTGHRSSDMDDKLQSGALLWEALNPCLCRILNCIFSVRFS